MSADLTAAARLVDQLGATIDEWPDHDFGGHALAYGAAGWEVHPLRERRKDPLTEHGVLDASTSTAQIVAWWSRWPTANIGGRVPDGVVVVDIDPRNGGLETWAELVAEHGEIVTRTAWSGRGDLGRHLYLRHPGGKLNGTIGAGLDVKTHAGYTVLPPSIHPDSGDPYRWDDPGAPIVSAPEWLAAKLRRLPTAPKRATAKASTYDGDSIADWFTTTRTWADVLEPHGWTLKTGNGDEDGSRWKHPTADHEWSATVKHGCLFVYSTATDFDATEQGAPKGYTRFGAFAVLDHRGDLSAAARAARDLRKGAA